MHVFRIRGLFLFHLRPLPFIERFFFIPQFALTLLSGIEGDHFFATQDAPSGLRADNLATVSVFGD